MPSRSDADLIDLSRRLLHDVQVLFHVGRSLIRWRLGLSRPLTWEVETALTESFALHTRALSDFFYVPKRGRHSDNAFAFDFFDHPQQWQRIVPEQGVWLASIKKAAADPKDRVDRFGEHLGHLTFKRPAISDYARGWPVIQVANEVGVPLRAFIENVPKARVADDFRAKAWRELPVGARLDARQKAVGVGLWARPATTRPYGEAL